MDPAITSLLTIAGSGIAAYYGAYFKKQGEQKAIADGFAQILQQTAETTKTTKAIEAKISNEVWDRQKQWELKREVCLEAIKRISAVNDSLSTFHRCSKESREWKGKGDDSVLDEKRTQAFKVWNDAFVNFNETRTVVDAICSQDLKTAIQGLGKVVLVAFREADKGVQSRDWRPLYIELFRNIRLAQASIRKELGINDSEAMSQSNESSATPSPAPPAPAKE